VPRRRLLNQSKATPPIMIGEHQRLLLIGQVDSQDRVIDPNQTAQPGQPGIAALVTTREPATLNHDVLLDALGTNPSTTSGRRPY
jgi:hypothetical protein